MIEYLRHEETFNATIVTPDRLEDLVNGLYFQIMYIYHTNQTNKGANSSNDAAKVKDLKLNLNIKAGL